jgi:hypothetical protein
VTSYRTPSAIVTIVGNGNGWQGITFHTNTKNTPSGQPVHLAYEKDVLRQSARYRPENTEKQDDDVQRGRFKSWKSEGRTGCRSRYAIKLRSVDTVPSRRCDRREDARVQPRCAHPLIARTFGAKLFTDKICLKMPSSMTAGRGRRPFIFCAYSWCNAAARALT